jgi:hypothetical protein
MNLLCRHFSKLLCLIGLVVLVSSFFVAVSLDILPFLGGILVFVFLVGITLLYPESVLLICVLVSILVPIDFAVKEGALFRIGPTRLLLAAFIVGSLVRSIVLKHLSVSRKDFPLIGFMALYVGSGLLSTFFSVDSLVSFYTVLGRDILEQFVPFYFLAFYLRKPTFLPRLKLTLFWGTALVCGFAFYEFITLSNPLLGVFTGANMEFRNGILRLRSTFFHPIALGGFLNLVFPFLLVEWIRKKKQKQGIILLFLILFVLTTLFLTMSRVPWLCLLLEVLIFAVWWGLHNFRNMVLGASIIAICSTGLFVAYTNSVPLRGLFSPLLEPEKQDEMSSEYYRVMLVGAVIEHLYGNRWIYGYGPNTFNLSDVEVNVANYKQTLRSPDNHYVRTLLEYGIVGAFFFCLLVIAGVWKCVSFVRNAGEMEKLLSVGCLASVSGFIALNGSASLFQMYPLGMLFWMSIAITINLSVA